MPQSKTSRSKRSMEAWSRVVEGLTDLIDLVSRHVMMNMLIRNVKDRMPALTSYTEALYAKEILPETLPATGPPATTNPPGQVKKAVTGPYPKEPESCRHPPECARRHGNAAGRFKECLQCGTVWSGIPVYPYLHGHRPTPGTSIKVPKGGRLRKQEAPSKSLSECYSCSRNSSTKPRSAASRAASKPTSSEEPRRSSAVSSESGKTRSKGSRDPPTDDEEETINLQSLPPEERERIKTLAAQRLEDRRREAAADRRRQEAAYHTGRQEATAKIVFEAEQDSWDAISVSSGDEAML